MLKEKPLFQSFIITFFVVFFSLQFFKPDTFIVSNILAGIGGGFLAILFMILISTKKEIIRFEFVDEQHRKHPNDDIKLPEKATPYSVGYDFYATERYRFKPKEKHLFWTDVKVHLKLDEKLEISPRSSIGIKKDLMLANTIGTIDPDYHGNQDNDGNIGICMYNYGEEYVTIEKDERFAQGAIVKVAFDFTRNKKNKRMGGIGSTGK